MYEIMIQTEFAAAHNLKNYKGSCEMLHGHNWMVDVVVTADSLDDTGLAIDFRILKKKVNSITGRLDHTYLNELDEFKEKNPSSENLAKYIFEELKKTMDKGITVKKVTVWENNRAAASYLED